jgi:hypothetical protein
MWHNAGIIRASTWRLRKNHENPESRWPAFRLGAEPKTSQIRVRMMGFGYTQRTWSTQFRHYKPTENSLAQRYVVQFWVNKLHRTRKLHVRRDSSVGIATGYGLDDRGIGVRGTVDSRIFPSPRRADLLWGPPSLLHNGYRVKRPGHETDHSPPASAEVKKYGYIYIYPLTHTSSWRSA